MTLGDLYPDVRLYSEVEKIIMIGGGGSGRDIWGEVGGASGRDIWGEGEMGGGSGRTYGKGRSRRRWQGDEERVTGRGVRELSPEVGREGNVWGEEMALLLQSCCSMCAVNC